MSTVFHNKFHKYAHHTSFSAAHADSSIDSIASKNEPFRGEFYAQGSLCNTGELSAQKNLHATHAFFAGDLSVNGNLSLLESFGFAASALAITNSGGGPALTVEQKGEFNAFEIFKQNNSAFVVSNTPSISGNVGINTQQPNHKLTVNGSISSTQNVIIDQVLAIKNTQTGDSDEPIVSDPLNFLRSKKINEKVWNTAIEFLSGRQLNENFLNKKTGESTIEDSGVFEKNNSNIGIGTTTPTEKLTVNGNAALLGKIQINNLSVGSTSNIVTTSNDRICTRVGNDFLWNSGTGGFGTIREHYVPVHTNTTDLVLTSSCVINEFTTNFVGVNHSLPNVELTINGEISSTNKIFNGVDNSDIWNNVTDKLDVDLEIPCSRVGDLHYLELDIKGEFKSSQATDREISFVLKESDGTYVGLRSGNNGIYYKLFYFTASEHDFSDINLTDIEYKPAFLTNTEYVSQVLDGNLDGMFVKVSNYTNTAVRYFWIHTQNTLNPLIHTSSNVKEVTSLVSTHNLTNLLFIPEQNIFVGCFRGTNANKKIIFTAFNASGIQLGSNYTQIDFDQTPHITFGSISGNAVSNVLINNWTYHNSFRHYVVGNVVYLSLLCSITLNNGSDLYHCYYNSVCKFNIPAYTFVDFYLKPYGLNPDNSATLKQPFCSGNTTSFNDNVANRGGRKIYMVDGEHIIESVKRVGPEFNKIGFRFHKKQNSRSFQETLSSLVTNPFDPTKIDWSNAIDEFVSGDSSALGKSLVTTLFSSDTSLFCAAQSKLIGEASVSTKPIICKLSDYNDTQTFPNESTTGLKTPSSIKLTTLPELSSGLGNGLQTTLTSNSQTIRLKNRFNLKYVEIDCNSSVPAITNSSVIELPSDYVSQIDAIVSSDPQKAAYFPAGTDDSKWVLYHIQNDLFLLNFCYFKNGGYGTKSFFKLISLTSGNIFVEKTTAALLEGRTHLSGNEVTGITNPLASSGVFIDASTNSAYIIYVGLTCRSALTSRIIFCAAKIDLVNKFVLSFNNNFKTSALSARPSVSIHPLYGPCALISNTENGGKVTMFYCDKKSVVVYSNRITQCFDDLITIGTTELNSEIYALTIKPALGFILYFPEVTCFIGGNEVTISAQTIDLVDVIGNGSDLLIKNKIFYVYLTRKDNNLIITFDTNMLSDEYLTVFLGTVTTGNVGITSSNFEKITRFGNMQIDDTAVASNTSTSTNSFLKVEVSGKTKFLRLYDI